MYPFGFPFGSPAVQDFILIVERIKLNVRNLKLILTELTSEEWWLEAVIPCA